MAARLAWPAGRRAHSTQRPSDHARTTGCSVVCRPVSPAEAGAAMGCWLCRARAILGLQLLADQRGAPSVLGPCPARSVVPRMPSAFWSRNLDSGGFASCGFEAVHG